MQHMLPMPQRRRMHTTTRVSPHTGRIPITLPRWAGLPITLVVLLLGWQALVMIQGYAAFILPGPLVVAERFMAITTSGLLWPHVTATLSEALGGFALAFLFALTLGYVLAHISWLERSIAPLLAASQAIPVLAVAPLIVLWFGTGLTSKVLIAALITFFPMLISTIVALRTIPRELKEMALISGASRWQMVRYVEAPLSLPVLFGGIRTGLALATTGAVVGEFVAGRYGLGALINIARGLFDTPLIFVALIMLAGITLGLYLLVALVERALVRWEA